MQGAGLISVADWEESTPNSKETRITRDEHKHLEKLQLKIPYDYKKNSNTFKRYYKEYCNVLRKYGYESEQVQGISLMGYIRVKKNGK